MSWYSIPQLLSSLAVGFAGYFVFSRNPRRTLNRTFAAFSLFLAVWLVTVAITYSLQPDQEKTALFWLKVSYTAVILILFPFLRLTILVTRLRTLKVWEVISAILVGFFIWTVWATDWFIEGLYYHHFGFYPNVGRIHPFFLVWVGITMSLIHGAFYFSLRHRTLGSTVSKQTKYMWLAYGVFTPVIIDFIPNYGVDIYPMGYLFVLAFVGATAYAIARHQLLDIRVVVERGLVYSILISCITATYLVLVLVMEKCFQGFFGYRSFLGTLFAAFLIAVFFNPLRNWIQTIVDKALFKATPTELAAQHERLMVEVRKVDQMKSVATLAAGMAHEIKNPLTSLKIFATYLPERGRDKEFQRKFERIVIKEIERIDQIVHSLLNFSKPPASQLAPTCVAQLLDETLEFLTNECLKCQVKVRRSYQSLAMVQADAQQLRQVFLNVLLNSLEAMGKGGQLSVSTAQSESELTVTIEDTGEGISEEHLGRIWEPFFTTKPQGTGLGLPIVRGIITEHGGSITMTSRAHEGTRCAMIFPLANRDAGCPELLSNHA